MYNDEIDDSHIRSVKTVPYTELVNEYVDYEVLLRIRYNYDGTRDVEIVDEFVKILDDSGKCIESITASMPKWVKDKAMEYGQDYEMRY